MDGLLDWYLLGVVSGLGVAAGLAARRGLVLSVAGALALGGAAAIVIAALPLWTFAVLAAAAVVGRVALRPLSAEAVPAAFVAVLLLAAVPALGYLEALVSPVAGRRLGRRAGTRYAGLRILARD